MSEGEIRRKRTSDPEMDAMQVMVLAFDPLSRAQIERILKWAEARWVLPQRPPLGPTEGVEAVTGFMERVTEVARKVNHSPADVLQAVEWAALAASEQRKAKEAEAAESTEAVQS